VTGSRVLLFLLSIVGAGGGDRGRPSPSETQTLDRSATDA